MFTGIIQQVGKLAGKENIGKALRLKINAGKWEAPLKEGESIAVNGVCLTAARLTNQGFSCDVLAETIACSNLNEKKLGAPFNLERALKAGEPLGGHMITGHVEGFGLITGITRSGRDWKIDIACESSILRYIIPKGSISCDGISLTVASAAGNAFSVNIIPFTWENTNLRYAKKGDKINLETDLIGKYVFRMLEQEQQQRSSPFTPSTAIRATGGDRKGERHKVEAKPAGTITEDILRQAGFVE